MNSSQKLVNISRENTDLKNIFFPWINLVEAIQLDFQAIWEKDPAVRSSLEIITCYPGFHALIIHRIAHIFYQYRFFWFARFLSYLNRWFTGIDIHPAAQLGKGIFIDHGMGVVIGETTIVGDGVLIYQGVTLGGTGKEKGKRHPTLGNNVIVGAGAKILGNIEIGHNSCIGAGSVTLNSVPDNCTVVGTPGRVVRYQGQRVNPLDYHPLPDPIMDKIRSLSTQIEALERELQRLNQRDYQLPEYSFCNFPNEDSALQGLGLNKVRA